MANKPVDIKKFIDAGVKLSIFTAQRLVKAPNSTLIFSEVINGIKTAIDSVNTETPLTAGNLALSIFQVISAGADLSKNLYVQDLESLANQLYLIITGGQGADFATVWTDIQLLFNGKLKGLPASEPNLAADQKNFELGISGIVSYIIQNLKVSDTAEEDIKAVIDGIKSGIDAFDPAVEITLDQAMACFYEVLEGLGDLTGKASFAAIEQLLTRIYALYAGNQSGFVKFFQSIGVEIQAAILVRRAKKEEVKEAK